MITEWNEKDIQGGILVSQQTKSGKWRVPMLISYTQMSTKTIPGLTDLSDGMFIPYESDAVLAKHLSMGGFVMVNKFVTPMNDVFGKCENRLELPTVTITHSVY